jgi:RNA-directed DNA polymerase
LDRIFRSDVLKEAWRRVRSNRGAAGVDRETLADVEEYGVERMLQDLQDALRAGRYRPSPVRRRGIPKPDGGVRPLGIPTVRDRVVQQAAKLMLEPIFEADFLDSSYGYRPKRSATAALECIRKSFIEGCVWVLELDIRSYFDSIDHSRLLGYVQSRVSDRRVVKLVRKWLEAGVMEEGVRRETVTGTPQGGVISPLLANIYLHVLDKAWSKQGQGKLVRYADDAVVLCRSRTEAEAALELVRDVLRELGLELHPEKTRVVDLRVGHEGFDFLGCHFHARVSGRMLERGTRRYYLHRWPSTRSMKRVRQRVRELTGSNRNGVKDVRVLISELNPILRGWGNYFRCVLRSCDGLAGESPVGVMTKQPRSWWPAEGETRRSKRHDKVASGGEQVHGPYVEESCRVVIACKREPSLAEVGEGHGRCLDLVRQHREPAGVRGSGTRTQSITEQERSVSAPE